MENGQLCNYLFHPLTPPPPTKVRREGGGCNLAQPTSFMVVVQRTGRYVMPTGSSAMSHLGSGGSKLIELVSRWGITEIANTVALFEISTTMEGGGDSTQSFIIQYILSLSLIHWRPKAFCVCVQQQQKKENVAKRMRREASQEIASG